MNTNMQTATGGRDLVLTRLINAPREKVYQAWTEPELLKRWFAPPPWDHAVGRDRRTTRWIKHDRDA